MCARSGWSPHRCDRRPPSTSGGREGIEGPAALALLTSPLGFPGGRPRSRSPTRGRLLLGHRADRRHADRRRQPAQPEPQGAHPRQAGGQQPGRVGQGPHRPEDDRRGRGRRRPAPGTHHHRAVVGQHRHRHGHDLPAARLPDQDRAPRERVDRAPPAARGLRRRDHPVARRRGVQRRGAPGPGPRPTSTPSGCSSTSTATRPTPGPTTRPPAPRSSATSPRSPTSSPAWAPAAPSWASAPTSRRHKPEVQILAVEPPGGRAGRGPAQPRGRLHPAGVREVGRARAARRQAHRPAPGVHRVDPPPRHRGRDLRRHLVGRGAGRGGQGRRAASRRAPSSSSSATAGGSTSRPAPTPTTSTRPRPRPSRSSTSRRPSGRSPLLGSSHGL